MAVTIVRTPWIDDDGTGTTGTVINNAVKTALYNDIDGGFAKLAQLAGGNALTGNQSISGTLAVGGSGSYIAATPVSLNLQCTAPGAGNYVQLAVGNDLGVGLFTVITGSSTFTPSNDLQPSGTTIRQTGAGGLSIATLSATPIRFYTNAAERMRIAPTGEMLLNTTAILSGARISIAVDQNVNANGIIIQNLSAGNGLGYLAFLNNVLALAGYIAQTSATTVTYSTSSDARLKDDAGRATDLSALRAVVVHDFAWKADGIRDRGIFAQEAHALYPRAVLPGTDETTESGDLARPWMTDYSKFVSDLIVGWQQHDADLAEIRALLATVTR